LYSFTGGRDGSTPFSSVVFDLAGNLYGTTEVGGGGVGTVFELSPEENGSWTETVLFRFPPNGTSGTQPAAGMVFDAAGNLYGTTGAGGTGNGGTVFELKRQASGTWQEKVLYSFKMDNMDAHSPAYGALILDAVGDLYGATESGGVDDVGAIFELKQQANGSWKEKVIFSFKADGTVGSFPFGGLVIDPAGNLYGTTAQGGALGQGTVFELRRQANGVWKQIVLFSIGAEGRNPQAGLVFDGAGNLYGTTVRGGTFDAGTVFELKRQANGTWKEKVLHNFNQGTTDGGQPFFGPLILDASGNLYGTTIAGGSADSGTAFEVSPDGSGGWTEKLLCSFGNSSMDGLFPEFALVLDVTGNLYGTTRAGGTFGMGTVFKIAP
jgi:uncharacterized repeat protein (TIGR03803 family)